MAMSFSILFKFEIDNGRNCMVVCKWQIKMKLLELLIKWGKNSCWKEWHGYMLMFDFDW
jgi:hypothetical protein